MSGVPLALTSGISEDTRQNQIPQRSVFLTPVPANLLGDLQGMLFFTRIGFVLKYL